MWLQKRLAMEARDYSGCSVRIKRIIRLGDATVNVFYNVNEFYDFFQQELLQLLESFRFMQMRYWVLAVL